MDLSGPLFVKVASCLGCASVARCQKCVILFDSECLLLFSVFARFKLFHCVDLIIVFERFTKSLDFLSCEHFLGGLSLGFFYTSSGRCREHQV